MKFDVVMFYYLDLQCTLGEMFANTCACTDDFIKKNNIQLVHVSYIGVYIFYTWRACYNLVSCVKVYSFYSVKSLYFILQKT